MTEVRANWQPSDGILLDRHGDRLHEMRVSLQGRRLAWVALEEVSPVALATLVHAEDRRFWEHHGIDWRAIAASLWGRLSGRGSRGASTITMQLAGLLIPTTAGRSGNRTLAQKWGQIRVAWQLENRWRKQDILEAWLNRVSFRGELEGIGAAARGLFAKGVGGLTASEGVILSALLRSPNADIDSVVVRSCSLARRVAARLACPQLKQEVQAALQRERWIGPVVAEAPQLARWLLRGDRGEVMATTIDGPLQHFVRELMNSSMAQLERQNVHNSAALVVDNSHGDVLAYVGNHPGHESISQVDGIRALRQAGSTLKPFIYELAIEKQWLTAASLLEDAPLDIVTPGGLYVPRNYEDDFKGWVSVRTALASSLNVPAVKTLLLVGFDPAVQRLRHLGFRGLIQEGDYYGPALALGSVEVSLWQLVHAYRALANGGLVTPLRVRPQETPLPPERIMSAPAVFIIGDILSDPSARALTFGLDNPLTLPFWGAVKTGTSKGMRDNWCIGYDRRWTVGVWVGNFSGDAMHDVSGITGAAPIWQAIMMRLGHGQGEPESPQQLSRKQIVFVGHEEVPRGEWFLRGTEMERVDRIRSRETGSRIVYPETGVIMALDPDIPRGRERVRFRMEPESGAYRWRLDGREMDRGGEGWMPIAGRHRLELLDDRGRVMDHSLFEVRGHR
ncbi:MAG: penicillin-binding protein 1C [Magnetococcales bacterium]|nr:penicillin-binding protein 1C [Magnetococcales bacterium]